jgi:hypothetical protein
MVCKNKREYEQVTRNMLKRLGCKKAKSRFNINSGNIIARGNDIDATDQYLCAKTKNCIKVVSYEDIKEIWVQEYDDAEQDDDKKIGFDLS